MTVGAIHSACNRAVVAIASVLVCASAAAADVVRIVVDHAAGTANVQRGTNAAELVNGATVDVRHDDRVVVEVIGTNTALYDYTIESEIAPSEPIAALHESFAALQPYVLDFARMAGESSRRDESAAASGAESGTASAAAAADDLLREALRDLAKTYVEALAALHAMETGAPVEATARRFRDAVPERFHGDPPRLAARDRLVEGLAAAAQNSDASRAASTGLLRQAPVLVAMAEQVEALALRTASASATWQAGSEMRLPATRQAAMTVRIARATGVAGAADRSFDFDFRLAPDWPVRPTVGVAFVASPSSRFSDYAADPSGAPLPTGEIDNRFTYGLLLGLVPRWTDWRETRGLALTVDGIVNPSDGVHALGAGVGLTAFRVLHVGAGVLWTRHLEPRGTSVVETYAHPETYLTIALAGWFN
jgi:hypothetical protein